MKLKIEKISGHYEKYIYDEPCYGWADWLFFLFNEYCNPEDKNIYVLSSCKEKDELYPDIDYAGGYPADALYDSEDDNPITIIDESNKSAIVEWIMSREWGEWRAVFVDEADEDEATEN